MMTSRRTARYSFIVTLVAIGFGLSLRETVAKGPSAQEEIAFNQTQLPGFVSAVAGLDAVEPWGRWSNAQLAPTVNLTFRQPLPPKFSLIITAQALGDNRTKPTIVKVGDQEKSFLIGNATSTTKLEFVLRAPASSIQIIPPAPVSPKAQGWSQDTRMLGIGLVSVKILPLN